MPHKAYTNGKLARDVGVLCLLAAAMALTIGYRLQVDDMRHVIYQRCMERQVYDQSTVDFRANMADTFRLFANEERKDTIHPKEFREERIAAWGSLAESAEDTVRNQVKTSCNAYR